MTTAAEQWRDGLSAWAIPDTILAQAPESPWIHPVEMFAVMGDVPESHSHSVARQALPVGGSVLDVGCGGGRASFALVPPAGRVTGIDSSASMLEAYAEAAAQRHVRHTEVLGSWPAAVDRVETCDVVVCHHVVYNVPELGPFLLALSSRARRRVVVELPVRHPLTHMSPLWQRFWGLERPTSPTADDALEVARQAGIDATLDGWDDEPFETQTSMSEELRAHYLRVRLCLPVEREPEVLAALREADPAPQRRTATLWWDVA